MKLIWTNRARGDLGEIISYIWADNPAAAKKVRSRIETIVSHLKSQPFAGRTGAISGTREAIPHPNYRIVYEVTDDTVFILRIIHTARQWPPAEEAD